ncbi:MAG: hypothetical protein EA422_05240 [Gemmatimonadales bacterium]|nr:MAG: hypothetical protein EA422_05240 [Gemmatimonadales bacterium]
MTNKGKLKDRARDELFSHINRCAVLQAAEEDQQHWMEETMEYLAERYPDLADTDLQELYTVGMRFCRPAIPHGRPGTQAQDDVQEDSVETEQEPAAVGSAGESDAA